MKTTRITYKLFGFIPLFTRVIEEGQPEQPNYEELRERICEDILAKFGKR